MTKMITGRPALVAIDDSLNNASAPLRTIAASTPEARSTQSPIKTELSTRLADLEAQVAAANEKVVNLEQALESNRRIGAAIGVVMALHHVTEPEAFNVLKQASQNRNCKLRTLADEVLLTGEVRGPRRRGPDPSTRSQRR